MNLIKTSYLSLISTCIKMGSGLLITKLLALYTGPAGLAVYSQFHNFIQISISVAKGGVENGLTKYTAQNIEDKSYQSQLFGVAILIALIATTATSCIIIFFSDTISGIVFDTYLYVGAIKLFGLTLILSSLNGIILSIINGRHEIELYTAANITQSILTTIISVALLVRFGLYGALIGLLLSQATSVLAIIFLFRKKLNKIILPIKLKFDKQITLLLLKFSAMSLVTAVLGPLVPMLVRSHIQVSADATTAGLWQAIWYFSSVYLMVVTSTLAVYYLPKFSSIKESHQIKTELIRGLSIIIPSVILLSIFVYFFRNIVVRILFSDEFKEIGELFAWMLVGDVLKIASWFFSYLMLAKAMAKSYIFTEIFFSGTFLILSYVLFLEYGLVGVTYAHTINYMAYLIAVVFITKEYWIIEKKLS
jgi:O-antigen/teichoic acid export membrane protein